MTGFELDEILKEYDISEKTLIDCVQEVIRVNPRINKSYQEVGFNWKDLSIFTIKRILESYNQSTINLRTREIVGYKENTEIKASYKGVFNVILTLTFNPKFEDGTTDVDMFALAKKHDGHFSTIYYNNIKEPGISLSD